MRVISPDSLARWRVRYAAAAASALGADGYDEHPITARRAVLNILNRTAAAVVGLPLTTGQVVTRCRDCRGFLADTDATLHETVWRCPDCWDDYLTSNPHLWD
ncbi:MULTISPECIES: hypothetical protein [Streptomycetaceae]|uniref:Uncharacterized protein n=1 Tax=Streptantibioticus cattleyicolor (strain ATCC 35852 / DSM 46488 / JCM 4925 / NBRC 14057 / NRRL 8057) TaxID=1003195 RepID=F8JT59_STREN|nr:hypothetical protein [Streptantibioticus cattleyicolor]AEW93005.1 hypothetical protein SCATT_06340 [Streptantibioticus cattleyicolor NRRL 8057 = DSM 46488]MYS57742.1 hypothetical protein [Streptomyces sp. SID5468]CCB73364.1 protein of unknown function [Streptantibioticus cattleyicolor NRRL 8057 = DSM 46488]